MHEEGQQLVPLYEDNHLLILNKPAGLLTQPSGTDKDSLEYQAKQWLKERDKKPGNVFLEAVHRLDKPVSGIVIFAKTSKMLSRFNASMRAKEVKKYYWGWVEGSLNGEEGTIENYLLHRDFHAVIVDKNHPEGKKAVLHYRVLERKDHRTLLEIELHTGRYHQIRLQLAGLKHPILGDRKYGSQGEYFPHAIALHHCRLEFNHPITHQLLTIVAEQPYHFGIIT